MHKISDSASVRWTVMILVSFTMMCGYILTDVMAPLKGVLESELGWNSSDYGIFSGAYGYLNVFLLMIIFGGLILDKFGIRFTGLTSALLMIIGTAIKYLAIEGILPTEGAILGIKMQVVLASLGFAIFGVGCEIMNITVTKIIVKWFKGKEIALALGLQVAIARIGTIMALMFAMPIAEYFGVMENGRLVDYNQSMPILMCLLFLCIGFIGFVGYTFYDKKLDAQAGAENNADDEEQFKVSDVSKVVKNRGFWLIAIICVFFYSAVFPFLKYATDLMINKYNVEPTLAGIIPSILPFGTMVLTPFFGMMYDRKGYGASIMIFGSLLLVLVHLFFALPVLNYWWFATILMFILGAAFSLVPSAMWPSVPKIIEEKQLGTAYALIFWVQNWGLMGFPLLIGWILDKYCITSVTEESVRYNYTLPMVVFAVLGVVAMLFAVLLKRIDKKNGYGLEEPNIKS